jgi:quinol-cytochrome oxidoreductase complex cytochrome b subunit
MEVKDMNRKEYYRRKFRRDWLILLIVINSLFILIVLAGYFAQNYMRETYAHIDNLNPWIVGSVSGGSLLLFLWWLLACELPDKPMTRREFKAFVENQKQP